MDEPEYVEDLNVTWRTLELLKKEGIFTIEDLLSKTETDLLSIKTFRKKTLEDIKDALRDYGLRLGRSHIRLCRPVRAEVDQTGIISTVASTVSSEQAEDKQYVVISGALISDRSKKYLQSFFREKRHERGEVLLIEIPAESKVELVKAGQFITRLEMIDTGEPESHPFPGSTEDNK